MNKLKHLTYFKKNIYFIYLIHKIFHFKYNLFLKSLKIQFNFIKLTF